MRSCGGGWKEGRNIQKEKMKLKRLVSTRGQFYNKFEYFYKIVVERNASYSNKFFSSTHLMKKFYLYKRL